MEAKFGGFNGYKTDQFCVENTTTDLRLLKLNSKSGDITIYVFKILLFSMQYMWTVGPLVRKNKLSFIYSIFFTFKSSPAVFVI